MWHIFILHDHNSGFLHSHILNFLTFVVVFSDLLFYFDIHIDKNKSYQFVGLLNLRNSLLYLII